MPLRRLELDDENVVGVGWDVVDVRVLTAEGDPREATFMLDTGLGANMVTPSFRRLIGAKSGEDFFAMSVNAPLDGLEGVAIPGLEVLGGAIGGQRYMGVWEGQGFRARCSVDWEALAADGPAECNVEWLVLPVPNMTEDASRALVGRHGVERVKGNRSEDGRRFVGSGVSLQLTNVKEGLLTTGSYGFMMEGGVLFEAGSGMRLQPKPARASLPLVGPLDAACTDFAQVDIALRQGIELSGMLGLFPLHVTHALEFGPGRELRFHRTNSVPAVASAAGLLRVPGLELPGGALGVNLTGAVAGSRVPAIVDSGSTHTILNWAALEVLFGIKKGDEALNGAPQVRVVGVGGESSLDMPFLELQLGLSLGLEFIGGTVFEPVRVAVGDVSVFGEVFGSEGGFFGFGQQQLPGALMGQDLLTQRHRLLAPLEPALYVAPGLSRSQDS